MSVLYTAQEPTPGGPPQPIQFGNTKQVPISQLPNEILSYIFLLHRDCGRNPCIASTWSHSWIRVSHVCRHWRQVAIGYAPLWSSILLGGDEDRTAAFLERSKDTPLTFARPPSVPTFDEAEHVYRHLHRTVALIDFDFATDLTQYLDEIHDGDALDLPLETIQRVTFAEVGAIPLVLSTASSPRMKSLSMSYPPFAFVKHFLKPTLTRLDLYYMSSPPSAEGWLTLFRDMPSLTTIRLVDSIASQSERSTPLRLTQPVYLDNLQTVHLKSHKAGLAALRIMDGVINPLKPFPKIFLDAPFDVFTYAQASVLQPLFQGGTANAVECNIGIYYVTDRNSVMVQPIKLQFHTSHVQDVFAMHLNFPKDSFDEMMARVFQGTPLPHIRQLAISTSPNRRTPMLEGFSRIFSYVSVLRLLGEQTVDTFIEQDSADSHNSPPTFFPNLTTLTFGMVRWNDEYRGFSEPWKAPRFHSLELVLRDRRERGQALRSLECPDAMHIGHTDDWSNFTDAVEEFTVTERPCYSLSRSRSACPCHGRLRGCV